MSCRQIDASADDRARAREALRERIRARAAARARRRAGERPTILEEAAAATSGPRQEAYGHPYDNLGQTAALWSAQFRRTFTAEDVAVAMVLAKVSRLSRTPGHRDSLVDLAGYARTAEMIADERARREGGAPRFSARLLAPWPVSSHPAAPRGS